MKDVNIKVTEGICYIFIGKSNLIFSLTDLKGNQLTWLRPAVLKFRGSKQRFSVFAMEQTVLALVKRVKLFNMSKINIVFSGLFKRWIGYGIVKAFMTQRVRITSFKYRVAKPHGDMRPKKKRRL